MNRRKNGPRRRAAPFTIGRWPHASSRIPLTGSRTAAWSRNCGTGSTRLSMVYWECSTTIALSTYAIGNGCITQDRGSIWTQSHSARPSEPAADGWRTWARHGRMSGVPRAHTRDAAQGWVLGRGKSLRRTKFGPWRRIAAVSGPLVLGPRCGSGDRRRRSGRDRSATARRTVRSVRVFTPAPLCSAPWPLGGMPSTCASARRRPCAAPRHRRPTGAGRADVVASVEGHAATDLRRCDPTSINTE